MEPSLVIMFENTEVNKSVYPCIYTSQKPNSWLGTQWHYTLLIERLDK